MGYHTRSDADGADDGTQDKGVTQGEGDHVTQEPEPPVVGSTGKGPNAQRLRRGGYPAARPRSRAGPVPSRDTMGRMSLDHLAATTLEALNAASAALATDTDTQPSLPLAPPVTIPTPQQVLTLLKSWQRRPTWDIEYTDGYEAYRRWISGWHDAYLRSQAGKLDITYRMANIVESIVKGWLLSQPVENELARILLRQY